MTVPTIAWVGPVTPVRLLGVVAVLGLTAAIVYTGVERGLEEKGTKSALGWTTGVVGGAYGLLLAAGMISPALDTRNW